MPLPLDPAAPLGSRRAIIRRNPDDVDEIEMIDAVWGSGPRTGKGAASRFLRSEGRTFSSHRCLIAASEFHMRVGPKRYRATLDGGNFFYLAAIWEPATADSPLSCRIVTVAANPDIAHYQERHGAIIQRRQVLEWLDLRIPESELLVTPPLRTFRVEEIGAPQKALAP